MICQETMPSFIKLEHSSTTRYAKIFYWLLLLLGICFFARCPWGRCWGDRRGWDGEKRGCWIENWEWRP